MRPVATIASHPAAAASIASYCAPIILAPYVGMSAGARFALSIHARTGMKAGASSTPARASSSTNS